MKVCPLCGDEFRDTVASCPDCEIRLITEAELASLPEPLDPILLKTGSRTLLAPLLTMLRDHGVPAEFAIAEVTIRLPTPVPFFRLPLDIPVSIGLYVGRQHRAKAGVVLKRFEAQQALALHGTLECPRCGAVLVDDAEECSFCSLFL